MKVKIIVILPGDRCKRKAIRPRGRRVAHIVVYVGVLQHISVKVTMQFSELTDIIAIMAVKVRNMFPSYERRVARLI